MTNSENLDFERIFEDVKKTIGKVNILLIGKTGVGKSTLINSIFLEDLAETGVGKPVSQMFREYSKEGEFYTLIDSKGLEMLDYEPIAKDIMSLIAKRETEDPTNHVHVAWYCISDEGKRIEDGEINLINEISARIPVIVVLTKSISKKECEFADRVQSFCPNARQVIRVLAQDYVIDEDNIVKARGLSDLIKVTNEVLPEAARNAFASAQKVDWSHKVSRARKAVAGAVTLAACTGATPIPLSDAPILAGIQVTMLGSISFIMGLKLDEAFLSSLVAAAIGVSGAVYAGKTIVTNLIKMIPGAGPVVGGMISGATAGTLTTIMGEAYIATLYKILPSNKNASPEIIAEAFKNSMKNKETVSADNA